MENNVRLIDANALKKDVNETINRMYMLRIDGVGPQADFLDKINAQPTIDLETLRPVGAWRRNEDGEWACTNCNELAIPWPDEQHILQTLTPFCPNCGAKMED